ncbi:hypothetical protein [Sulfurimonas sp. HSL3-2]|uniref:hypothetical protein n=1 Tax=Hydrocurvibacter mobilis TaxID=3131936 RepID=UPI0031F932F6
MYNRDLGVRLFFTFLIVCLIFGFVFPLEFFRDFFRILFIIYMPITRIGVIVTLLIIYIIYVLKRKNTTKDLNDSNKLHHIVFAITIALFMNGMLQLLSEAGLVNIVDLPFLINKYKFVMLSLTITLIVIIPYIIFIFSSKSTYSLSELMVNTLLGVVGLSLTVAVSLKEINMYFDKSKPKIVEGFVESKRVGSAYNKSGRGHLYYVTYSGCEEREVPTSTYGKMEVSDKVNEYIKDGYLGIKWVSKIKKIH